MSWVLREELEFSYFIKGVGRKPDLSEGLNMGKDMLLGKGMEDSRNYSSSLWWKPGRFWETKIPI